MTFGPTLKAERKRLGVSAAELAERTGWTRESIHRIERQQNVSERTARRYAAGLNRVVHVVLSVPTPSTATHWRCRRCRYETENVREHAVPLCASTRDGKHDTEWLVKPERSET